MYTAHAHIHKARVEYDGLLYRTRKFKKIIILSSSFWPIVRRTGAGFSSTNLPISHWSHVLLYSACSVPPPPPLPTEIFALTCCASVHNIIIICTTINIIIIRVIICIYRTKSVSDTAPFCHWTPWPSSYSPPPSIYDGQVRVRHIILLLLILYFILLGISYYYYYYYYNVAVCGGQPPTNSRGLFRRRLVHNIRKAHYACRSRRTRRRRVRCVRCPSERPHVTIRRVLYWSRVRVFCKYKIWI